MKSIGMGKAKHSRVRIAKLKQLEESNRSTCSSPSSSGSCPASPFPWIGISIVAAFPRIPSVMAREGTGVKVSTPARCKAQHRQFWKLASTPEQGGLPCVLIGFRGCLLGLGCPWRSAPTFLEMCISSLPSTLFLQMHVYQSLGCLLTNPNLTFSNLYTFSHSTNT